MSKNCGAEMYKKVIVIVMMVVVLGGCQLKHINIAPTTTEPYQLTDRQIEALESVGLPADYEALSVLERRSIRRIEEGLSYLDQKYGERFLYTGYIRPSYLDKETLYAVQEKDPIGVVKVIYPGRDEDDSAYRDDFMNFVVEDIYDARIIDYYKSELSGVPLFANITVSRTLYQHPDEVPDDIYAIDGKIRARIALFLDGGSMTVAEYEAFIERYKAWSIEHQMGATLEIALMKPGYVQKMLPDYYYEYVGDEYCIKYDRMPLGE